jgi:hypothetical protein
MTGIEPVTPSLPRKYSTPELHRLEKRGETKINFTFRAEDRARTGHPQLGRLTLYQMSYFRLSSFQSQWNTSSDAPRHWSVSSDSIFESLFYWWGEKDSNLRTPKRTDLQSGAVGHLAISPTS